MAGTVAFPVGNLAPEGSVVKATAIDPRSLDADGVYRFTGPARVFTDEHTAIEAIKTGVVQAGEVIALIGCGPAGTGMEETYQLTSALKHVPFGRQVALLTDARFSGVSTGACIGHVGPEALAGGPVGRLRTGDLVRIEIDTRQLTGTLDFVGRPERGADARPRARSSWPAGCRWKVWRRIPSCPPTPACGPRCSRSAVAPGVAASTTWTPSSRGWADPDLQ